MKEFACKICAIPSAPINDVAAAAKLLASLLARREQWLRNAGRPPSRKALEAAFRFERDRLLARANALQRGASVELAADVLTKKFTWRVKSKTAQVLARYLLVVQRQHIAALREREQVLVRLLVPDRCRRDHLRR